MSDPANQKNLWKNIDWKTKEEKQAFFNKYFNGKDLVNKEIDRAMDSFKSNLTRFIENDEITENKQKRRINNRDIINEIKNA